MANETKKKRLLIIDDDEITRMVIFDLLSMTDYIAEFAEDGREGVRKAHKKKYDLIMLDLKMPGVTGDQVMKILKRINTKTPVIVISGNITRKMFLKLKTLGVRGFLVKPFGGEKFFNTVEHVLKSVNLNSSPFFDKLPA